MKPSQRVLALVLCLGLCIGLAGCSQGNISFKDAESKSTVTVTPPSQREVVDFSSLSYTAFDEDAFLARVKEDTALLAEPGNEEKILSEYSELTDQLRTCLTSYTLGDIKYYLDYADTALQENDARAYTVANDCNDAFSTFLSELLKSDYRAAYVKLVGEDNASMYEDYQAMTDEQKDMLDQEKALEDQYTQLAGEEYDSYEATAAVMAPLYVQLVELRNKIAASYGYDNYVDYAYTETYSRSYTPEDARTLEETVKKGLSRLYVSSLVNMTDDDYDAPYRYSDASPENLVALMKQYMPQMDASIGEAFDYMLACNAYDITYSDKKYNASFTTMLQDYDLPFLFSQPTQDSQVLSLDTFVHEFGHYYSYLNDPTYASGDGFVYSLDDIDVAEINSTALELSFLHFYPELYGDDADTLEKSILSNILSNVVFGCMLDEFQQKIYTAENLTADDVSSIFHDIFVSYMGDVFIDDYSYYYWSLVNHNFDSPMYYISYGVSALAAFQIWQATQEDFTAGMQKYLTLTAYGTNVEFQTLLKDCGMEDVFSESYLQELYKTLKPLLA